MHVAGTIQGETLANHSSERPLVLIIDDDTGFARSCARLLGGWGYEVEMVLEGSEAVRRAHEREFDVILSDINVPDMSGLQILRSIRQHDRDVPVSGRDPGRTLSG